VIKSLLILLRSAPISRRIPFINALFCDSDELTISGKGYEDLWDSMSELSVRLLFDDRVGGIKRSVGKNILISFLNLYIPYFSIQLI